MAKLGYRGESRILRPRNVYFIDAVQFLVTFVISLMKSIDIRSQTAVKLLAEFLDIEVPYTPDARFINAEHFAHGTYNAVPFSAGLLLTRGHRDLLFCPVSVQRSGAV